MENNENVIIVARRKEGKNNMRAHLSALGIAALIFVSDLTWFLFRKNKYGHSEWWDITFLVISSIFLALALLGLMFARSNTKYNQKVMNEPLLAFIPDRKVFTFQSFIEFNKIEIDVKDIINIEIDTENDEARINYLKNGKETSCPIGYSSSSMAEQINKRINELKEEYGQ